MTKPLNETAMPKVFISYSWTSPLHRDQIRGYADRLLGDGVEVIIDQYDLIEGQDKFHFMEKMMTDPSVTHVLVFSDRRYVDKANSREAGVGAESQIMSPEIYEKVEQTKFIPIFCELDEQGHPCLPHFLKNRIGLDFSSPEKANENWERLIRLLHGKPEFKKPAIGAPPSYLDKSVPVLPSLGKFVSFKTAAQAGRPVVFMRQDFLDSVFSLADDLRQRLPLKSDEEILSKLHELLPLRDQLVEWMIFEIGLESDNVKLFDLLHDFLERLLALRFRPKEVTQYQDWWFDAHGIFVYEIFLYTISALIKFRRDEVLNSVLIERYLLPEEANSSKPFGSYQAFNGFSRGLEARNERLQLRRLSPVADVLNDRATRGDVTFKHLIESDAVVLADSLIHEKTRWIPLTLVFAENSRTFPLFARASEKRGAERLLTIFGMENVSDLKKSVAEGLADRQFGGYSRFHFVDFDELFRADQWAS